jgi:hypothetical protein
MEKMNVFEAKFYYNDGHFGNQDVIPGNVIYVKKQDDQGIYEFLVQVVAPDGTHIRMEKERIEDEIMINIIGESEKGRMEVNYLEIREEIEFLGKFDGHIGNKLLRELKTQYNGWGGD